VIMAAGKGTRMKNSDKPKVMFEVNGKPMIEYVVELAQRIHSARIVAIVGFQRELVIEYLRAAAPMVEFAVQDPQLGTGHAVMQTEELLKEFRGDILVLSGDVPMLRTETISRLLERHHATRAVATILTTDLEDPTGYGRVLRSADGSVAAVVEHKDATEEERKVKEINSGIYVFKCQNLFETLRHITPHNVQKEYYLPDVFDYFKKHDLRVTAMKSPDANEIRGVNTVEQLAEVEAALAAR
jgi:UDP-N-acetylglucosamine pyrophosphorylase